jgi:hypothetical protein
MKLINSRTCIALAVVMAAGLAACKKETSRAANTPDPSAQVIGVVPAAPTGDPPGTTPVTANTTEVTKAEENTQKPSEGDNHSHSTLDPNSPQKADSKNPQEAPSRSSDK